MTLPKAIRRWIPVAAIVSMWSGCATIQDSHYEHTQHLRTQCAWLHYSHFGTEHLGHDYGKGWRAGYLDVLTGGNGEPPLVAPHEYWRPSQVLEHCDSKRQEWYVGFQDGAMMAKLEPDTHYLKMWTPGPTQTGYAVGYPVPGTYSADPRAIPTLPAEPLEDAPETTVPEVPAADESAVPAPMPETPSVPLESYSPPVPGSQTPPPPALPMETGEGAEQEIPPSALQGLPPLPRL